MTRAANRQVDIAVVTAWHTAIFALSGYSGKLKGKKLSDFLSGKSEESRTSRTAEAIAFFHALQTRGLPVEITRH